MLTPVLLLMLLLPGLRRMRRSAPDKSLRLYRLMSWGLGGIVLGAMAAQETILLLAGQLTWATGLPLHLCSLMGLTVLPALVTRRETLLSALLYAGVPGAALALLFPAVADTPWPGLTRFFFLLMHAGIVLSPLLPMAAATDGRAAGGAVPAGSGDRRFHRQCADRRELPLPGRTRGRNAPRPPGPAGQGSIQAAAGDSGDSGAGRGGSVRQNR